MIKKPMSNGKSSIICPFVLFLVFVFSFHFQSWFVRAHKSELLCLHQGKYETTLLEKNFYLNYSTIPVGFWMELFCLVSYKTMNKKFIQKNYGYFMKNINECIKKYEKKT